MHIKYIVAWINFTCRTRRIILYGIIQKPIKIRLDFRWFDNISGCCLLRAFTYPEWLVGILLSGISEIKKT